MFTKEKVVDLIIDVSMRSAKATEINIFEFGSLNDLIPKGTAEQIRKEFVKYNTPIKQVTNSRQFASWTSNTEMTQNVTIRYVPADTFSITNEILIFDDTVAVYRLEPDPFYSEIHDELYANIMRNVFMNTWRLGDSLLMAADGSTYTKQYMPVSYNYKNIPIVIYPAKDDGLLERAFSRNDSGSLEKYVNSVIDSDSAFYENTDMLVAYVWNQDKVPYCDMWKVNRNGISDDSGFLYDARIYKDHEIITDMGVASGNSSIVLTAEEMLLRDLVISKGLSFTEAADREVYQARFPMGFVPAEKFYE